MKTRYILLSLFIVPAMILAMTDVLDTRPPPSLSLPAAYNLALGALGADTNQYYCVQATTATYVNRTNSDGWTFAFRTTNVNATVKEKCVDVDSDGKTHLLQPKKKGFQ